MSDTQAHFFRWVLPLMMRRLYGLQLFLSVVSAMACREVSHVTLAVRKLVPKPGPEREILTSIEVSVDTLTPPRDERTLVGLTR